MENLDRMKKDFKFLIKMIQQKDYIGEFDLALRYNYFNIYYQGNSLAKIDFCKDEKYKITVNNKFFDGTSAQRDNRFKPIKKKDSFEIDLDKKLLHPFFQKKYINEFVSNIRKVNYSEELVREQAIITDNLDREEIIFIDRQIMGSSFPGRLDLLAIQQVEETKYSFLVIEVKLGNNRELKNDVAKQLKKYSAHIDNNFNNFKACYEKQYKQKKYIGLIGIPNYKEIEIVRPVKEMIVSLGYSGIGRIKIDQLRKNYPDLDIRTMNYHIDINKDTNLKIKEKKLPKEINQAIKDLTYKFMTINDYYQAIDSGKLVRKPRLTDDMRFYSEHPEHPMAGDNRFRRIKAADTIRSYVKNLKEQPPQDLLDQLHVSLFDCCAAVRHSVVQSLFYGGNDSSVPFLERLKNEEKESKVVKKVTEIALLKLKSPYPLPTKKEKIVIFMSNNIDLALALNGLCLEHDIKMIFPEADSPDIFAIARCALIVDRNFIDRSVWESFCDYCEEGEDDTPVFIIDANLKRSLEEYPVRPNHDNVYLVEQWLTNVIKNELSKLIQTNENNYL